MALIVLYSKQKWTKISLNQIKSTLAENEAGAIGFSLFDDKMFFKGCYVLTKSSPFISVLLREYHDSPLGGHTSKLKTYLRVAAE